MKTDTTSVLGFDVPVNNVPETLSECVEAAGGEQNLIDGWLDYIRFHKTNTAARAAVVDALAKETGIARKMRDESSPTKADANRVISKPDESEQTYADRVRAELKLDSKVLWEQIKQEVGSIDFKAVSVREPGAGRLAKVYTTNAETLIKAGADTFNKAVAMLEQKNPGLTVEKDEQGVPTIESLAAALKQNRQRIEAESNAELGIAA